MKSRIRRFWMSVSLATSALALPLSGSLWSHDLPIRWTSGANSTPSWNQLLDDCQDDPQLAGPRSLLDSSASWRRATEDWASSCPAEWTQTLSCGASRTAAPIATDLLARNPLARFSKEMTCWVNEWHDYQSQVDSPTKEATWQFTWAARPTEGQPPAPYYAADGRVFGPAPRATGLAAKTLQPELPSTPAPCADLAYSIDTCMFDAEHQARQAAADLLAAEMARAAAISAEEARFAKALADVASIEKTALQDALSTTALATNSEPTGTSAAPIPAGSLVIRRDVDATNSGCGGQLHEIITQNCFPNRFAGSFGAGQMDEYLAYDLDDRDSHWLGGLNKSWKLRSALAADAKGSSLVAGPSADQPLVGNSLAGQPCVPAPEEYIAPDSTLSGATEASEEQLPLDTASTEELNQYLDAMVDRAQRQALHLLEDALASSRAATAPQVNVSTDVGTEVSTDSQSIVDPQLALPSIGDQLSAVCEWVELQQCWLSAEMCGFEHAFELGSWIARRSLDATEAAMENYVALGLYLEPASAAPDLVVIYVDADGTQLVVPGSVARAWNRPQAEVEGDPFDTWANDSENHTHAEVALGSQWLSLDHLRRQAVKYIAGRLDSIGMACLQTSDQLTSWEKVASHRESDQGAGEVR